MEHNHKHKEFLSSSKQNEVTRKRMKIDTGLLYDRLHRPDGVFATIRAHDLWRDVDIIQSIDPLCTTCKIMSIPAHARESRVQKPLDEIQVDKVPNPEPVVLSADTRFNYFLIICDRL